MIEFALDDYNSLGFEWHNPGLKSYFAKRNKPKSHYHNCKQPISGNFIKYDRKGICLSKKGELYENIQVSQDTKTS